MQALEAPLWRSNASMHRLSNPLHQGGVAVMADASVDESSYLEVRIPVQIYNAFLY